MHLMGLPTDQKYPLRYFRDMLEDLRLHTSTHFADRSIYIGPLTDFKVLKYAEMLGSFLQTSTSSRNMVPRTDLPHCIAARLQVYTCGTRICPLSFRNRSVAKVAVAGIACGFLGYRKAIGAHVRDLTFQSRNGRRGQPTMVVKTCRRQTHILGIRIPLSSLLGCKY